MQTYIYFLLKGTTLIIALLGCFIVHVKGIDLKAGM